MGAMLVVLTCCERIGKQLGWGPTISGEIQLVGANGARLIGLFSMLLFGFTLEAVGPIHVLRLVVPAIDIHRRRV